MEIINDPGSRDSERRSMEKDVQRILEFSVCLSFSLLLLLATLYFGLNKGIFLSILALYNVLSAFRIVLVSLRGESFREEIMKYDRLFYLTLYIMDFLTKLGCFIYLFFGTSPGFALIFHALPGIIGPVARKTYPSMFKRFLEFLHSSLRVFVVMDLLLLTLSDTFGFNWSWKYILFPTLAYFSIIGFLVLSYFVCVLLYSIMLCSCEDCGRVMPGLSINFILLLLSGSIQYLNSIVPDVLDSGDWLVLQYPIYVFVAGSMMLFVYFSFYRSILINWLCRWFLPRQPTQESDNELQPEPEKNLFKRLPKIFARVSAAFYKPINRREFRERMTMSCSTVQAPKLEITFANNKSCWSQDVSIDMSELEGGDDNHLCAICCNVPSDAVFFSCGHGNICYQCGLEIKEKKGKCHICRECILEVLQVEQNERVAYCKK